MRIGGLKNILNESKSIFLVNKYLIGISHLNYWPNISCNQRGIGGFS